MTQDRGRLIGADIAEQPEALSRLLNESSRRSAQQVAATIGGRRPRFVLLAARGNSDHAALYAKYLVEVSLGLPAGMVAPSAMTAYGARPDLSDVLLMVVSRDGDATDLQETLRIARAGGATTLAVTNEPDSTLAREAELQFDVLAGPERSSAATKSYTCELLALWLVVDAVRGGDGHAASTVPDAVQSLIDRRSEVGELATRYRTSRRFVTTARGYSYPTAREAALQLIETAGVAAHAYSGADLLHGPLAMIEREHPVIAVVPDGRGAQAMHPVLERLADRGAEVAVFGAGSSALGTVGFHLDPPGLTEALHPVVDIVALQQLALELALIHRRFDGSSLSDHNVGPGTP